MLTPLRLLAHAGVLLISVCIASIAGAAYADPPGRVARLSHTQGEVSYSPAGEDEWVTVVRNRPLIRGDRLWTDRDARAEFQVGSDAIRLGSNTSVRILDLTDRIVQVEMTQGSLSLRVRRMYPGQVFEVATPTLAFTITRAGRYRIDVDPRDDVTTVVVWDGAGEAYGESSSFPLRKGDTVRFYGTDLRDYETYRLPREDAFDRYCLDRDQRLERSVSLRYVTDDVVGYADLDEYGDWRPMSGYGTVWFPSRVESDWAPYRDGHWVWQEPWGWTWVDNAPWGFAPSHYGRWVSISGRWGWIPGPRNVRPVYAPALVVFVGGRGWSVSLSLGGGAPIGWFPLGPREVYVPSYQTSRDYFTRVNVSNTVINNTTITNVYNNYSSGNINVGKTTYVNRTVTGAVTAVPDTVFVNARPVRQAAIKLDRDAVTSGELTRVAPVAPSARSVIGAGTTAKARPTREALDRRVVARTAPPPVERPFAAREPQLQKEPGRAPTPPAVESGQVPKAAVAPNVRVLGEQRGAVDARAAGSRREADKSGAARGSAPGQLRQLERSSEPVKTPDPGPADGGREKEQKGGSAIQPSSEDRGQAAAEQQEQQRQRKAESDQQAVKQQAERQRQDETQRQQEQRQRKVESDQQAERQRQDEAQRQQEQRQRKVESDQQAERQRQAECERQAILRHEDVGQCLTVTPAQEEPDNRKGNRKDK